MSKTHQDSVATPTESGSILSRRKLIRAVASVASVAAIVPAVRSLPAEAMQSAPDPIFAAIERHRRAWAALEASCSALAETEYDARQVGDKKAERKAKRALRRLHNAVDKAEDNILDVIPTSIPGASALLAYAAEHGGRGDGGLWGTGYIDERPQYAAAVDGYAREYGVRWEVILHRNLAEALPKIARDQLAA
jgi:hypothetical protein